MSSFILDHNHNELEIDNTAEGQPETVDSYIRGFHFDTVPGFNDEINDSDDSSIDRLLRRNSREFTPEFWECFEEKFRPSAPFSSGAESLECDSLMEIFGTGNPEKSVIENDDDLSPDELRPIF